MWFLMLMAEASKCIVQVIQPILAAGMQRRSLQKPILVITITDGEPTGEPRGSVVNVIKQAKNMCMNSQYGPGAITFEFAQVRIQPQMPSSRKQCLILAARFCCLRDRCSRQHVQDITI